MDSTASPDLSDALFAPRSIALVGASADRAKASSRPLTFLRASGYAGKVFPINHKGGRIDGEQTVPSVTALEETPDHAFIMTPTSTVLDAVVDCGRAGVRVATILSGGFGEVGPKGLALQQRVCDAAASYGLRLLGPNSLGVVNTHNGLILTANAAFAEPDIPRGGLFVASQSGSLIGALLSRGASRGLGFSRLVSVGAEMDLGIGDICGATLDDPEVTGYLLFLETVRHADRLRAFANAAAARGKPVIAYKLGKSAMAAELSASHTGALAGEDDVASAFLADLGIAHVHTLEALIEAPALVSVVPPGSPGRGRRVGVVTTTGGGAALVVDQLGVRGIEVAAPSPDTLARMREAGVTAEPGLITDLTLAGTRPEVMRLALDILTRAPEFDLILAVAGSSARHSPALAVAPIIEVSTDGLERHPIATFVVPEAPEALQMLTAAGIAGFRTPESCADAIAASLRRREARMTPPCIGAGEAKLLDEAASYRILAEIGVPVAPHVVLPLTEPIDPEPPPLSYPLAVKALSDRLPHKSDVGGVVLGVRDHRHLVAAVSDIRAAVARTTGVEIDAVLAQEMSAFVGEVLVGYRDDPVVGPIVLVAAGGTLAELYADRSIRMAPVDRETASEMLSEITAIEIMRGYRGGIKGDLEALTDIIVKVSELAYRGDIAEAEINPILVREAGFGVVAVDAAVRIRSIDTGSIPRRR